MSFPIGPPAPIKHAWFLSALPIIVIYMQAAFTDHNDKITVLIALIFEYIKLLQTTIDIFIS